MAFKFLIENCIFNSNSTVNKPSAFMIPQVFQFNSAQANATHTSSHENTLLVDQSQKGRPKVKDRSNHGITSSIPERGIAQRLLCGEPCRPDEHPRIRQLPTVIGQDRPCRQVTQAWFETGYVTFPKSSGSGIEFVGVRRANLLVRWTLTLTRRVRYFGLPCGPRNPEQQLLIRTT